MLKTLLLPQALTIPYGQSRTSHRGILVIALIIIASMVAGGWEITLSAMSDAYLSVAVFVAGTLLLVRTAERSLNTDLGYWLDKNRQWQVPAATLLGAFPGCGGAIVAVTQYTRGYLSFGSVVATLTATMGDAMFLLLARGPGTALLVLCISMPTAIVTGYVVDLIHGADFLRPPPLETKREQPVRDLYRPSISSRMAETTWLVLIIPSLIIGILAAFQIDIDGSFIPYLGFAPAHWIGVAGASLGLIMWIRSDRGQSVFAGEEDGDRRAYKELVPAVASNTNFVMAWVIFAFVSYELLMASSGIELAQIFSVWKPLVPGIAILIGFVPGCGPQILITTLYLSDTLPLSAQLGNAIANDGDALFPAIAIAPLAAVIATVYSSIPAVLVAYGWFFLFE